MASDRPSIARINRALSALAPARREALAQSLADTMFDRGVWLERAGTRLPVPVTLRPRLIDGGELAEVGRATYLIRLALRRLSNFALEDPACAALLPLDAREREWLVDYRRAEGSRADPRTERVFCRLDAIAPLSEPGWGARMRVVETNVVGVGGVRYSGIINPLALELVRAADPGLVDALGLELPTDPRALLLDDLLAHAKSHGAPPSPTIALLDDKRLYSAGGECGVLAEFYAAQGYDVVYAAPHELVVDNAGRVHVFGREVHVVYRTLDLRELIALEDEGFDLAGVRAAFRQGIMMPTVGGDLEHKSALELLSSATFAGRFDAATWDACRRHILWTRLLTERHTEGPAGVVVDLFPFARGAREALVLKPNRGYGGEGVLIGAHATEREWDEALSLAAHAPGEWVVQSLCETNREPFIDVSGTERELFTTCGFFPSAMGTGMFGRAGSSPVVNLSTGASLTPFLVSTRG